MTFDDWAQLIVQSNVVAAVVVGIFGIVTLKLGRTRFRSERWWEKKAAAYASVILLDGYHVGWVRKEANRSDRVVSYAEVGCI
jgi:NADH:ubiquinone oxidoreductase subunit 6 (subunit J)